MQNFRRAFSYALRYRRSLACLCVCVLMIGTLYSVGIGSILPVLKIMLDDEGVHGWVRRKRVEARLGIEMNTRLDRASAGFRVVRVRPGTPAADVLAEGDEIAAVDGLSVAAANSDRGDMLRRMLDFRPGGDLPLTVRREGRDLDVTVRPAAEADWLASVGRTVEMLPDGGPEERLKTLVIVLVLINVIAAITAVTRFCQEYLTEYIAARAIMDLRTHAFDSVVHGSMTDITGQGVHDVLGRFGREYEELREGFVQVLGRVFREPVKMVAVIAVAFYLDWTLTLACCVLVPVAAWLIRRLGKKMHKSARRSLEATSGMTGIVQQTLLSLRVVKAYNSEGRERRRFLAENRNHFRQVMKTAKMEAISDPLMEFLAGFGAALMAVWAAYLVFWGRMEQEQFFAFIVCMVALADPARKLSSVSNRVRKADAAAKRVFELIDRPDEAGGPGDARVGRGEVPPLTQTLTFEGVWFGYQDARPVLSEINLIIRAGEKLAVVGPNGGGKTTLVSLVPRFFSPARGRILWDGRDLADCNLGLLRRRIALVTQDAVIFKDTVHANIAYGEVSAPREAVIEAAKKARAHEFITGLTDAAGRTGYDAVLTELGHSLSGGQRQRIALARAILRDPSVLILDEATSAIDPESAPLIRDALDEFVRGRTTLIIAHSFNAIRSADRIVVLDAGRVVGLGPHAELLRTCPLYRRLCEGQFFENPTTDEAKNPAEAARSPLTEERS